ncbi:hypothetical protein D3C84_592890 [compost metagenome]
MALQKVESAFTPSGACAQRQRRVSNDQQIQHGQQADPQPFAVEASGDPRQVTPGAQRTGGNSGEQRKNQCRTRTANPTANKQDAEENQTAHRQPLRPVRRVRHRPGQHAFVLAVGIEQSPVAADRAFTGALPWLVEGFDQVVMPALLLGHGDKSTNEFGFVDPAR